MATWYIHDIMTLCIYIHTQISDLGSYYFLEGGNMSLCPISEYINSFVTAITITKDICLASGSFDCKLCTSRYTVSTNWHCVQLMNITHYFCVYTIQVVTFNWPEMPLELTSQLYFSHRIKLWDTLSTLLKTTFLNQMKTFNFSSHYPQTHQLNLDPFKWPQ